MDSLLDLLEPEGKRRRKKKAGSKSFRPHAGRLSCTGCEALTKEYRHKLSKQLGESLITFYVHGGHCHLRDLNLSYSRRTNFQKLRYFGLVEDDARTGVWTLTDKGRQFVKGEIKVQEYIWTWRADALESEGEGVLVTDLVPDYSTRVSYAQEGRPHDFAEEAQEVVH